MSASAKKNGVVLVVDDAEEVRESLALGLGRAGFEVVGAGTIRAARAAVAEWCPSMIIVDRMFPDGDGLGFCREVRRDGRSASAGILVLSALQSEEDRIAGLQAGADDYVGKPFSVRELTARVRLLARATELRRRTQRRTGPVYCWRELVVDVSRCEVRVNGAVVTLRPLEFKSLCVLMASPHRPVTREELASKVWPREWPPTARVVMTTIARLRRALGAHATAIETVQGTGYALRR